MKNDYGMALIKKDGIEGLTKDDILELLDIIGEKEVYPIEIFARKRECSAMGFITHKAAETFTYAYRNSTLHYMISDFLDGATTPHKNNTYEHKGIKIWLKID